MKIIHKYPLKLLFGSQWIQMPEDANILDIQMQDQTLYLWAEVDPDNDKIDVEIESYPTGHEIYTARGFTQTYLKTIQDGYLVFHFCLNSKQIKKI